MFQLSGFYCKGNPILIIKAPIVTEFDLRRPANFQRSGSRGAVGDRESGAKAEGHLSGY